MHRDLLDALRCPQDHAESWLVAMVHRADGTRLLEADLACPVCGAEFRVENGVGIFGAPSVMPSAASSTASDITSTAQDAPDVARLAAQLGVLGGLTPVLLAGRYAAVADAYAALTGAPVVVVSTTTIAGNTFTEPGVSVLQIGTRLPLGLGTLAAAAFDPAMFPATLQAMRPPSLAAGIVRAVRAGGRLVTPATSALPPDTIATVRTVARDDTEWVGEVTVTTGGLVTLRRQPPET